jgi:hypothetical protein
LVFLVSFPSSIADPSEYCNTILIHSYTLTTHTHSSWH